MNFPAYPKYKDSGIEWLGKVPEDWEVKPLSYIGLSIIGLTYSPEAVCSDVDGALVLRASNIQNGQIVNADNVYVDCEIPPKLVTRKGDILICSRSGSRDLIGKCAMISKEAAGGSFGAFNTVYRSEYSPFVYWTLNSHLFKAQSGAFMTSTINQLTISVLKSFRIPFPQPDEQQAIADFLDTKTAQLDVLLEKKRALVERLKEQRSALISHAVTRGLDPEVKLKPSGIEWLGDIPEHWEVYKMTHVCSRILDGTHFSPSSDFSGDYKYITAKNIKEYGIELSNVMYVSEGDHREIYSRCPVQFGDVLYIKDGATAGIATVNTLTEEFSMLSSVALLRPNVGLLESRFFAYQLNSKNFKAYLLKGLVGGAMTRFTLQIISGFKIVIPEFAEQTAIADYLDKESGKIDCMVEKVEAAIEKLEEYRSALISAAVTGKIDVREVKI